jgi:uncharacterized protein YndB with AHSA1/START domain
MVSVAVPPAVAFEVFTAEIDRWWRRGLKYRHAGAKRGFIHIEPEVGGRLFEQFERKNGETRVVEVGRVLVWDPPARLVFTWRNETFSPTDSTEVEVLFTPTETGTQVTVRHRGWETLRPDHPAKHGMADRDFARSLGMWWGEQLSSLREEIAQRKNEKY